MHLTTKRTDYSKAQSRRCRTKTLSCGSVTAAWRLRVLALRLAAALAPSTLFMCGCSCWGQCVAVGLPLPTMANSDFCLADYKNTAAMLQERQLQAGYMSPSEGNVWSACTGEICWVRLWEWVRMMSVHFYECINVIVPSLWEPDEGMDKQVQFWGQGVWPDGAAGRLGGNRMLIAWSGCVPRTWDICASVCTYMNACCVSTYAWAHVSVCVCTCPWSHYCLESKEPAEWEDL